MKTIKKLIIILISILLICSISLILLIRMNNNIEKQQNGELESKIEEGFVQVDDYHTYYKIKEIINQYILYMKQINGDQYMDTGKLQMTEEEIRLALQQEGISAIKKILDNQYIEDLLINENMIKKEQDKYKQNGKYDKNIMYNLQIEEVLEKTISENITIILVNSKLNNEDFKMIIKLDQRNNTFSIFLGDYIEKYNYNKDMSKTDIKINTNQIEINDYNSHINVDISEKYIISQYFSEYRMKMLYDTKRAYELLDEEYRQKKYGNYENFVEYIKNNKEKILYASIDKYQVTEYNGFYEYVCIDTNGKYYVFTESSITDYDVILDTYTVELPEFLEKYNNNEDKTKCGLNIQKIFDAINDGDYKYVYEKLDDTFKHNNFPTEETFEKYIQENFANNQLEYNSLEKNGNLYMCNVTILDGRDKTFIMKLLEGTDFIFSFDI